MTIIEGRSPTGARLDHPLEFRPAVIGSGSARFNTGLDKLAAARRAVRFTLTLLIGDRDFVLGLPRRGDAQIPSGSRRHGHRGCPLRSSVRFEQFIEESPNHVSNTSNSASVIGTGSGQSSVTVQAATLCLDGRPIRGQGSGSM